MSSANTTHGNRGWIVQAQPTPEGRATAFRIPPTAVGGLFKPSLHRKAARLHPEYHPRQWVDCSSPAYTGRPRDCIPNTTHGSGWIVQAQPKERRPPLWFSFSQSPSTGPGESPRRARERRRGSGNPGVLPRRPDLNDPPTAVGGIQRSR